MSIQINLGVWNSIFAVPSAVVDEGLKFSDGVKLKVLLYVLRHSGEEIDEKNISSATGVNITDIPEALEYWISRNILFKNNEVFTPAEKQIETEIVKNENTTPVTSDKTEQKQTKEKSDNLKSDVSERNKSVDNETKLKENNSEENQEKKQEKTVHIIGKPQKPDYVFTSQQLAVDEEFKILVNEAQTALGKTLSNSDASSLLMLKNTCGLPIDVIIMLIHYCISIDKANIRAIESIGVRWSDDGIFSIEAAENKIKQCRQSSINFSIVSSTFGLKNVGSPSAKQIEYADTWIEKWKFSPEMLREAYERCLDSKSIMDYKYINGILRRWHSEGIFNIMDLQRAENKNQKITNSKNTANTSYDINDLEKYNYINKI